MAQCIEKTHGLQESISLPDKLASNAEANSLFSSLQCELGELSNVFAQLQAVVVERRKQFSAIACIHEQTSNFHEDIQSHLENLPSFPSDKPLPSRSHDTGGAGGKSSTPMYRSSRGYIVETPCVEPDGVAVQEETVMPSWSELRKKGPSLFMPSIEYLTEDEFNRVPKYMKGRLSLKQINSAVDELNKAIDAKYVLLKTSKARMTEAIRRTIQQYKEQERKETKGSHFVVDEDLVKLTRFNSVDRVGKSIVVILRHCGRIREVRGGGLTRYCIC